MADRYRLEVTVEVNGLNDHDGYNGERLSIRQQYVLPAKGFTEIAGVLGRFHDLAEEVKADGAQDGS